MYVQVECPCGWHDSDPYEVEAIRLREEHQQGCDVIPASEPNDG